MKYIKRIGLILLFIIGLTIFLGILSFLFVPKNNMAEAGMEEARANGILGEKDNTIDVLVLGDSESYSSIIPLQIWEKTGYTSYVCGTAAQTLDYSYTLLKRAFRKQSPKIVFLETNAIYRKLSLEKAFLSQISEPLSVFRYHDRWKTLKNIDFGDIKYTWKNNNKGYRFSKDTKAASLSNYMTPTTNATPIPELNRLYVTAIKRFCEEKGATFILLSTPSTVCWNYSHHNGIEKLAKELRCEFLDMNLLQKEVPIDWKKDTRDKGDHLNYYGATKVTAYLTDYLSKTALLTDQRQQAGYEHWDEALKEFEKESNPKRKSQSASAQKR